MAIYKDQTAARLILQTGINFNNYSILSCKICYEKPNGVTSEWTSQKLVGGEISGKIYVDFSSTIKFDVLGIWRIWAFITFPDSRTAQGDIATYKVVDAAVLV